MQDGCLNVGQGGLQHKGDVATGGEMSLLIVRYTSWERQTERDSCC